jgi:hypothetical protein
MRACQHAEMFDVRAVAGSFKRVLPVALVLFTSGCGEPECSVATTLSGAIMGPAVIDGAGEDFCTAEKTSGLVIISFSQNVEIGSTAVTDLQVNVQSAELVAGTFPATVVVGTVSSSFTGDACTITIANVEREDWTVTDYVNFTGMVSCTAPLDQLLGGFGTLELGATQIQGHVLYE